MAKVEVDKGAVAEGHGGGLEADGLVEGEKCLFKFVLVE
jgi:hypothetical protein